TPTQYINQYPTLLFISPPLLPTTTSLPAPPFINYPEPPSPLILSNSLYQTTPNLNITTPPPTNYKIIITIPKPNHITPLSPSPHSYNLTYSYPQKPKNLSRTRSVPASYIITVYAEPAKP
uniref:hypothetical protein n=1 Tax=Cytobacillus oceanisediminis TaxID=665099 RepID=UPI001C92EA09